MLTLDECYDVARRVSHGMPPSDFGSTRAIKAFGETLRAELLKEIEACARIASGSDMSADCDDRGVTDPETGEVPCSAEARSELAHKIAAKIRARAVSAKGAYACTKAEALKGSGWGEHNTDGTGSRVAGKPNARFIR